MKIDKAPNGDYIVSPSTSDEAAHLAYLLEGLEKTYGSAEETGSSE